MEFLDARRLTGPSLLFDRPGSILDVACSETQARQLAPLWEQQLRRMLARLDWRDAPEFAARILTGGVSLGFTAPIDALYTATAINEWAWHACLAALEAGMAPDFDAAVATLAAQAADEANGPLLELASRAAERGITLLWDDDEVSLGLGRHACTWPVRGLPDSNTLGWGSFADVPVGLVTGTNGKTTTVRLAAAIVRASGARVGISSTDYIAIDDRIVDRDDWSGPGGARKVLRHNDVDAAILETARGGLLRRGVGVVRADAALITNIASDHLGDFGSRSLQELLDCKWIVSRTVARGGKLVLNADDPLLVARAAGYTGDIVWFSLDPNNQRVQRQMCDGGTAFFADDGKLQMSNGNDHQVICHDKDVPITLAGAARHNVANALAAAALTWSMGIELEHVRAGLRAMSQDDNPGRGNMFVIDSFRVLVDFAHNPQALQAIFHTAARLEPRRVALCFGQAGDRPDKLIRELARNAWEFGLDQVFVSELAKYHRGREAGAVFGIIRDELMRCGARDDQVQHHEREIESLNAALTWAAPGDLVIMIALERSPEIYERLRSVQAEFLQ